MSEERNERISTDDLARYQWTMERYKAVQAELNSEGQYLAQKYQLGPQDRLNLDGSITRAPSTNAETSRNGIVSEKEKVEA